MPTRQLAATVLFVVLFGAMGCGPAAPERTEQPLTAHPSGGSNDFDKLTTPEEKIRYIENSHAPKFEKERAIEQIRSGKL